MQHINKWNEELRNTLKGKVEHRLFLQWVMESDDERADVLLQRLLDVRFERKKCEAIVKQARFDYEHLQSLNLI